MIVFLFKPFTSAEPGSLGELLEVLVVLYCVVSLIAPLFWFTWRGIDDTNRLRQCLSIISIPFIWPLVVAVWSAQALASYIHLHFRQEIQELIPKRKPAPELKSPQELDLWE